MRQIDIPAPDLARLQARTMWLWRNPAAGTARDLPEITSAVHAARNRMARAEGLIRRLFTLPDTGGSPIASALIPVTGIARHDLTGPWFVKGDHALPVAGSIKARGGFHEIIAHAEALALAAGLIAEADDLAPLASPAARALFAGHAIVVGSTGNLGMSIGLCGAALGFRTIVHMSTDAKAWKKDRLRRHGVEVVEHAGDYGAAVAEGRALAAADPKAHFVDDEHSLALFCGYACAAFELAGQLQAAGLAIGPDRPLVVTLPCGVGGAPGGIVYGLKLVFGENVDCLFAEPVESPCMLVQMLAGVDQPISVYDIGLTNRTELDGLAVAQASPLVAPMMVSRLAGIFTVSDATAHDLLRAAHGAMGLKIEPSAATALALPAHLDALRSAGGPDLRDAVHVAWATGGALVPEAEFAAYLAFGTTV